MYNIASNYIYTKGSSYFYLLSTYTSIRTKQINQDLISPQYITMSSSAIENQPKDNRVRDNQRRSRARQKDHLVKQENKLRELQANGIKPDHGKLAPMAEELIMENRRLRELLRLAKVSNEHIEAYLAQDHARTSSA